MQREKIQQILCRALMGVCLILPLTAQAQLPAENTALYFSFRVDKYKIQVDSMRTSQPQATITLKLGKGKGDVMTDRPYRLQTSTDMEEFIAYLHRKPALNLSLLIHQPGNQKALPLNFEVTRADYKARDRSAVFKGRLIDSPGSEALLAQHTEKPTVTGQYSMLMAEG